MTKTKRLTPREARTEKQQLRLTRDNVSTRDYWMMLNGGTVVLSKQRSGQPRTEAITISRAAFERFIDWYNTGQFRKKPRRAPNQRRS